MLPDELRSAANLIRSGRGGEARPILARYVQAHPDSEQGWLLLSMVLRERQQQMDCLARVLSINPANGVALERMAQIRARAAAPSAPAAGKPESAGPATPPAPASPAGIPDEKAAAVGASARAGYAEPAARPRPATGPVLQKAETVPPKPAAKRGAGPLWFALLAILAIAALAVLGFVGWSLLSTFQPPSTGPLVGTPGAGQPLPPSWTPTLTPTGTPVPTATLIPTPTPTPTLVRPEPTMSALMERIQIEVSDIRGLESMGPVDSYVVSRTAVRPILEANFQANGGSREQMDDQARVLSALGLIKPTYDMYTNALNGLTDSLGGFYFPWSKELYVIGGRFGGVEHFIYSHEYAHALVDQHYDIGAQGVYPKCLSNADRCQAIQALVEGDATLVMQLWWRQYASPTDFRDIQNYVPPQSTLPEQYPPPYAVRDSEFPYLQGYDFVRSLHDRGNWPEVNKAYARLPESSEQILHPDKYRLSEAPQVLPAPTLEAALGAGWRKLTEDTLGEWTTYLLLGYGADTDAALEDAVAKAAASGWGGDRYQVYYHDGTAQSALAVAWGWDTTREAGEFLDAMTDHLGARFRNSKLVSPSGACWQVNQQVTCLYLAGRDVLWILAPDIGTLDSIRQLYPDFRRP